MVCSRGTVKYSTLRLRKTGYPIIIPFRAEKQKRSYPQVDNGLTIKFGGGDYARPQSGLSGWRKLWVVNLKVFQYVGQPFATLPTVVRGIDFGMFVGVFKELRKPDFQLLLTTDAVQNHIVVHDALPSCERRGFVQWGRWQNLLRRA